MLKSPKEIAISIVKSKPLMERAERFGEDDDHDYEDSSPEELVLLAEDIIDAKKRDDAPALADALSSFIKTCREGY